MMDEILNTWYREFKGFLGLPMQENTAFSFGTFTPETIPALTVQFIHEQTLKFPKLNLPTFDDYKGFFANPPKLPKPPSKTEISQQADNKFFGYEPDRELWKDFRYQLEWTDYQKDLARFEKATNQHRQFERTNAKTETGYLFYLKSHYPALRKFLLTSIQRTLNFDDRLKHSYITGSTEAGKSELIKHLVYPFVLEKNPSSAVVVVDPNGDMALELAQFKEFYQSDRLVYFDPFLDQNRIPVINPFFLGENQQNKEYIDKTAQALVNVFEEMIEGIGGSSLTNQMNALLFPCLYVLLGMENQSLADLQTFMKDKHNRGLLEQGKKSPIKAHRDFFNDSFELKPYQTSKHGIYTKILSLLNSPAFYDSITGQSTLNLEECIRQKKIIIFNLSKGRMGENSAQALGRFVIARILAFALNQAQLRVEDRITVHLVIDECQNYISSFIENILVEARKYRLYLTLAQQLCGQGMNTQLKKTVLSCTALKLTGMNSLDSLSTLAKETGAKLAELEVLETGVFHCKVGKHRIKSPSLPVQIPARLLGSSHAMTKKQWQETKQEQLKKYYRPAEELGTNQQAPAQPAHPETTDDVLDFGY